MRGKAFGPSVAASVLVAGALVLCPGAAAVADEITPGAGSEEIVLTTGEPDDKTLPQVTLDDSLIPSATQTDDDLLTTPVEDDTMPNEDSTKVDSSLPSDDDAETPKDPQGVTEDDSESESADGVTDDSENGSDDDVTDDLENSLDDVTDDAGSDSDEDFSNDVSSEATSVPEDFVNDVVNNDASGDEVESDGDDLEGDDVLGTYEDAAFSIVSKPDDGSALSSGVDSSFGQGILAADVMSSSTANDFDKNDQSDLVDAADLVTRDVETVADDTVSRVTDLSAVPSLETESSAAFSDVTSSTPHSEDIEWLASQGISNGFRELVFRPYASIARCDVAAFLRRAAIEIGIEGAGSWSPSSEDWRRFKDVDTSTSHATDILWLAHAQITTGFSEGTFRP